MSVLQDTEQASALAECLRLPSTGLSVEDSPSGGVLVLVKPQQEAKTLVVFSNGRLACSALNMAERRPSLHSCPVL